MNNVNNVSNMNNHPMQDFSELSEARLKNFLDCLKINQKISPFKIILDLETFKNLAKQVVKNASKSGILNKISKSNNNSYVKAALNCESTQGHLIYNGQTEFLLKEKHYSGNNSFEDIAHDFYDISKLHYLTEKTHNWLLCQDLKHDDELGLIVMIDINSNFNELSDFKSVFKNWLESL